MVSFDTKPAKFYQFHSWGVKEEEPLTPAVACATTLMLDPYLLNFFSLDDFGLIIDSAGVTDADNSQSIASPWLTNFACNVGAFGFSTFGSTEQTSSIP